MVGDRGMEKSFNSSELNKSNRILYLDFARGLAVFFMIMQHAMIMHEVSAGEGGTVLGNIFILLGTAPAAPVFIFIMGVFCMKSSKSNVFHMKRGFKLIIIAYLFNIFRFVLPILLVGLPYEVNENPLSLFLVVDIFQLAGLSLICFPFLRLYAKSKIILSGIMLVMLLLSPFLWGMNNGILILDPLIGVGPNVDFPLFPWGVYFILGIYMSQYFNDAYIGKKVMKKLLVNSIILGVIGLITLPFFQVGDYYRSGLSIHLLMIGFIFIWMIFCNYCVKIFEKMKFNNVLNAIYFWSQNVTGIYIIQWLIFGWSILLIGANEQSDIVTFFIGLGVMLVTHLLFKFTKINLLIPKM